MTTHTFKPGDRVAWNGSAGTWLRYSADGRIGYLHWDRDLQSDGTYRFEQEDEIKHIKPLVLLTIDDVAGVGENFHSPFGAVITEDGTIYNLLNQCSHGIVCAVLFPELAKEQGYAPPAHGTDDPFVYQRFELDNHDALPVIRVSFRGLPLGITISRSTKACTPAQIDALRRLLTKGQGITLNDIISTEYRDSTLRTALKELAKERD